MRYLLLSLLFVASLCRADTFTPVPSKIVGPGGSKISIEGGNATIQPSSGGAVNVVTGAVYVPTVLDFSTSMSPLVSASGHSSLAFDGTNLKLSLNGGGYVTLGATAWGAITGDPADQADLAALFAGKVATTRTVNGHALSANVSVTASDLSLGSVENTALSTWAGSTNLTTLGTIGTGTWNATAIADGKIASALTGKTYNGLTITSSTGTLTIPNGITLNAGAGGTLGSGAFATAFNPAIPGAIGGTTPAAGSFTTITASGAVNGTTIPTSKTLVVTTDTLAVHAATTSAQLAGIISDETGTGSLVFGMSPFITTGVLNSINAGDGNVHYQFRVDSVPTIGVTAIGWGGGITFSAYTSNNAACTLGHVEYVMTNVTAGAHASDLVFKTYTAAAESECLRVTGATKSATTQGDFICAVAGKGLQLKSGTGARAGNATLVGGTVTVPNTTVTANSIIYCGRKTPGGTLGQSLSYSVSSGTSFTITSVDATGVLSALDTSVVSFIIVELN